MDEKAIAKLIARKRRILYGKGEEDKIPPEPNAEEEVELIRVRKELDELEKRQRELKKKPFDSKKVQRENELRRMHGLVKQMEIAESLGIERLPHTEMIYYDSYPAYVKLRLPNPNMRLVRVFNHEGDVLEEDALLLVNLSLTENFWPRDRIYVEPSPYIVDKWQLVGQYNHKGMRLE